MKSIGLHKVYPEDVKDASLPEKHRILIVEDDPGVMDAYREILSPVAEPSILSKGSALFKPGHADVQVKPSEVYQLSCAKTGGEAIALFDQALSRGELFSLAFIDMKMPGMNGAQTAKHLWQRDPSLRIVIVTAYSEYSLKDIIIETGRDDIFYLRKPFNSDEIRQFAKTLIKARQFETEKETLIRQIQEVNGKLNDLSKNLKHKVKSKTAQLLQAEKMASLGMLAAGVAHEINNPITYINSNLIMINKYHERIRMLLEAYGQMEDRIKRNEIDKALELAVKARTLKKTKNLDFIYKDLGNIVNESLGGTDKIQHIVNDLRIFSRADGGRFEPIDVNATLDATLNIMRNVIKHKVKLKKDYGNVPEIFGNPQKISQVFMNILLNAVQAIEEQGEITIASRLVQNGNRMDDKHVKVVISDTGKGIPKKHLNKIIDPFFTTKPPGEGTGLGLSIAYDIVRAHGGSIAVDSTEGKGTTVTIKLPVNQAS